MNAIPLFEFKSPTRILFGLNAIEQIGDAVRSFAVNNVFLVTDKGVADCGVLDRVVAPLARLTINYEVFDEVESNPSVQTIERGAQRFAAQPDRLIVALGGGSPIDAAKAIAVKATHADPINDYTRHGNKVVRNVIPPLIAIPTTAGTGSEVTWVSVLVDHRLKRKIVIPSVHIAPKLAILDPSLTRTLPPAIGAATGMDALTHAIETYVSLKSEPISDALALRAIQMISPNLREVVSNGENLEARSQMLLASTMAGLAFINGSVGLVHSLAQALGGRHDVPHGLANAIMLPVVMRYNLKAKPSQYSAIARAMGENIDGLSTLEAAQKAVVAVAKLADEIGIPRSLEALGIKESMFDQLAEDAMDDKGSFPFNPRRPTKKEVVELLQEALRA
ncbi:MAG: iron-containing alcohol dehydrogenase [Desulfobacterales bacterium]|nr:MAG: iron-containing alcohol dehydrogenase [Desulfobacterales bacterium]